MKTTKFTKQMKLIIMTFCLIMGLSFVTLPMTAYADGADYDIEWLGGEGNGTFSELEKEVQQTGNSAYRLMMAVGSVMALLSLLACAIMWFVSGSGQDRSKTLGWLIKIAFGCFLLFGAIGFIGMFQTIGKNIF